MKVSNNKNPVKRIIFLFNIIENLQCYFNYNTFFLLTLALDLISNLRIIFKKISNYLLLNKESQILFPLHFNIW